MNLTPGTSADISLDASPRGRSHRASRTISMLGGFSIVVALVFAFSTASAYEPQIGDIVFHTSLSSQSLAIQQATGSPYSHMGIVLFREGRPLVFEAVQPVKYTELKAWLDRGKDQHYVVKRLKTPLSSTAASKLTAEAERFVGKSYDLAFEWSDERIYCSELVWKLYQSAGDIELAPLARLGSFDLDAPAVQMKLKERYGSDIPLDEPVIAPSAIFDSPLLETVARR